MIAVAIILNGISRKKNQFYSSIHPALVQKFNVEVFETQWPGHARELARERVQHPVDIILAAGGDGTLSQVVNGILDGEPRAKSPDLGLIPLGTGNDFARACGITANPGQLISLLESAARPTDVGRIHCCDGTGKKIASCFINVCSMGMGPEVVARLEKSNRALGPSLTYFKAIATTFLMHRPRVIRCQTAQWNWNAPVRVLAIANGKSFGHSLFVAPDASPDDGMLNSFIAGPLPLWRFLYFLQTIKSAKKIRHPNIRYHTIDRAEFDAPEPCAIEADGERIGFLPAEIDILPGKINFLRP
jgi:diacylglycerol kinase (ATP)